MNYSLFITHVCLCAALLSSCELFGGRDEGPGGGEVVWKDSQLKAYTLKEGKHLWNMRLCQQLRSCDYSRTIVHDGDLLFIDQGFFIKAISKASGALRWSALITNDATEVSGIGSPVMSQDAEYLYAGATCCRCARAMGPSPDATPSTGWYPKGLVREPLNL